MRKEFGEIQEVYNRLTSAYAIAPFSSEEKKSLEEWSARLQQPAFYVVFIGTFNAGKSTIINALLGRALLGGENASKTARATEIRKAKGEEKIIVYYKNQDQRVFSITELERYSSNVKKDTGDNRTDLLNVERVEVHIQNLPYDDDIVLVDTPGFDVADEEHKRITREYREKAHAIVVCFDAGLVGASDQDDLVKYLGDNPALLGEKAFWVLNKWNTKRDANQQHEGLESADQKAALRSLDELLAKHRLKFSLSRRYKISAGSYLVNHLKKTYPDGVHLSDIEKYFISNINLDLYPCTRFVSDAFNQFREDLLQYLIHGAKREFVSSALMSKNQLVRKIKEEVDRLYDRNSGEKEQIEKEKNIIRYKEVQSICDKICAIVDKYSQSFLAERYNFWNDSRVSAINEAVAIRCAEYISTIHTKGFLLPHILTNDFELPDEVNKIPFPRIIYDLLQKHVEEFLFNAYFLPLYREIKDNSYLSPSVTEKIEKKNDINHLNYRIKGWVDATTADYAYEISGLLFRTLGNVVRASRQNELLYTVYEAEHEKENETQKVAASARTVEVQKVGIQNMLIQYMQELLGAPATRKAVVLLLNNSFAEHCLEIKQLIRESAAVIAGDLTDETLNMDKRIEGFLKDKLLLESASASLEALLKE